MLKKIKKKLNEYNIKFTEHENVIVSDKFLLTVSEKIFINFHVFSKIEESFQIFFMLSDIKNISTSDFVIGESYIVDDKGQILMGENAYKLDLINLRNKIIQEFIRDQEEKYFLINAKAFEC